MPNESQPFFSLKPGYIVLSRADYDDMVEQRVNSRNDRIDEQMEADHEISRLHRFLEEKQDEIVMLHNQIEENKRTIETLRHQIFALSTVKEDLMADVRRRDDYLAFLGIKHLYIEWMEERAKEKDLEQEPIDFAINESRERE